MNLVPVGSIVNAPETQIFEGGTSLLDRALTGAELTTGTTVTDEETLRFDISQVIGGDGLLEGGYTHGNSDGADLWNHNLLG